MQHTLKLEMSIYDGNSLMVGQNIFHEESRWTLTQIHRIVVEDDNLFVYVSAIRIVELGLS